MLRQRPAPTRTVGAVACLAVLGTVAAGCGSGDIEVDSPALTGATARTCAELVTALPDAVSDLARRELEQEDRYVAAWGDPAIVLRCGVPAPAGFDELATCQVANDVAWFVPEPQIEDQAADVVMTTVGRAVNVEVQVPAEYRPPAAAMIDLAAAIKASVREIKPCL
jgi:hypothetical protein